MPTALLDDRALISVSGLDAEHLLQNVITTDLEQLLPGEIMPGALLTPQGKILFDFLVSRAGENALLLDCRADVADDLVRRLTLYRLRAKAELRKLDQQLVLVSWRDESSGSEADSTPDGALRDRRFPDSSAAWRSYGGSATSSLEDRVKWERFRILNGIAESGSDFSLNDVFPHDVLLDQTGGVGFRKGCYVGQEVVSRMQHRGTARRRVLVATGDADLPSAGTDIQAAGRPVGTLGSSAGRLAIAIVRIDKVKAAMDAGIPITAGEAKLTLAIPAWATFTFPQDAATAEEA
ncbi:folate-binding protein YgfZ [Mesorhizobium sp. LHD-90]|uniref:CAF17-like 4Fe-4S cluster assembly/insertion protein YgfZ n=1 Tax=Mesorhizobium sp. LHD-90 TaxID=3071414 RepID=UPI0027E0376F|nr:folate-binding protein YgfZ [Mesorhizobium sp. LHD-90]MDQ6437994.1 folate-binding protein YgfZ [Mesorhizobium sp. LHD-90]